jgi:deferrochelatase/peroxidase EfeB
MQKRCAEDSREESTAPTAATAAATTVHAVVMDCPAGGYSRRRLLRGLGASAAAWSVSAGAARAAGRSDCPVSSDSAAVPAARRLTDAPGRAAGEQRYNYLGRHQAGIVTPRPATGMVAAFDVLAVDRDELQRLLRSLTARIAFLTQGGVVPQLDPRLPPPDSGILGPVLAPDGLTITLSVGASLFDERFGLAPAKPRHLQRMQRHPNDALDGALCHGDLSVQFCAHSIDTCIHALRDLIKNLPDLLMLRWKQEGNVPASRPAPGQPAPSARNFLGFRDGSANPDAADAATMDQLVWVTAERDEPLWARNGSYQAVRIIRNFVERWDRTPLGEQEAIMGRRKDSGAPLDQPEGSEYQVPLFFDDPHGQVTPLDAHIRLANPRTEASQANLILRRPFNYSNGVTKSGQLDMGLLFICYQADLEAGFITVQKRLDGEPLEEYIKPVGGGFFFSLPGITDPSDYFGRVLLEATA